MSESPYAVYLKSTELLIVLYTRLDTVSYCILFVVNDYIGIICRDVFSFSGEFGTTTVKLGGRYKSIRSMNYE